MQNSAELTGWLAYLQVDDEVQIQRTTIAIMKAFGGSKRQAANHIEDDDEPIIDTTAPDFAEQFQGFTNAPGQKN